MIFKLLPLQGAFAVISKVQFPLHHFADGFHLLALSLNVLVDIVANGIQVVEELGNAILYHVWLAYALVSKRVNYHLDAFFFKMNIYFGSRHNRVAVIVYHARLASRDMQLLTTERFDFREIGRAHV